MGHQSTGTAAEGIRGNEGDVSGTTRQEGADSVKSKVLEAKTGESRVWYPRKKKKKSPIIIKH